jgi:ATP-binding cassette subfamily B protein
MSALGHDLERLATLRPASERELEPLAAVSRYPPPKATIAPDRSLGWIRRMAPILRAHGYKFTVAMVGSLVGLLLNVSAPRIIQIAIDDALDARTSQLSTYVTILAVITVVRGITGYTARKYIFEVAYGIEFDLRHAMYSHLTRLSFPFYDEVATGQLVSRANSDIRAVQLFLTFGPIVTLNVTSVVLALGFMVTVSVPLTLMAIAPLPFVLWLGLRMRQYIFPMNWIVMARQADIATTVEENVSGVRVVKSFAAERQQIGELADKAERLRWAEVKQADINARYSPILENLPRIGLAGVLLVGGILAIDGRVGVGAIVAFSAYVLLLQTPFRFLGFILMMSQRAAASAQRIYEVLDQPVEIVDRPGAVDLADPVGAVELRAVRFGYGDGPDILRGLDLRIEPGETVALVGRTGSGKSTIARLLPRFYDVRDGAVLIDGRDVRDYTLTSLRAHIGVVLDEPFLFSASIRDNIAFGRPGASHDEVVAAARAANALEFIEALPDGFDEVIGERGYTLSGGQRQRIAIARTLLVNPKILVLDDATSAIDVKVEQHIHDALRDLMRDRTTLVIAHRLSTISLAERVVLLEGGRIVAQGTHAELMRTEPRYAEVLAHLGEDAEAHLVHLQEDADARARDAAEAAAREADSTAPLPPIAGGGS